MAFLSTVFRERAPRLAAAAVSTSDGGSTVRGVDGDLDVDAGGGELFVDRIAAIAAVYRRRRRPHRGGGRIARVHLGAGRITVGTVHGEAVLSTEGGDIGGQRSGPAGCARKPAPEVSTLPGRAAP